MIYINHNNNFENAVVEYVSCNIKIWTTQKFEFTTKKRIAKRKM